MKKVLPALAMLIVTAMLLGTSTFAWFSMTTETPVDGMELNVKTYDNLLVAPNTNSTAFNNEYEFVNELTQTVSVINLEPASTINGTSFYYNKKGNARANGERIDSETAAGNYVEYDEATAIDGGGLFEVVKTTADAGTTYKAKTKYDADFNDNYEYEYDGDETTYCFAYADYNFQLKAQNAATSGNKELKLTALNLTYQENSKTAYVNKIKAFRVAVFIEEKDTNYPTGSNAFSSATAAETADTLKAIFTPSDAVNFSNGKAVKSASQLDTVTYNTIAGTYFSQVSAQTTKYYQVTVRLWLEGEDKTCFNEAFVKLDKNWKFDLVFALGGNDGNVSNLNVASIT